LHKKSNELLSSVLSIFLIISLLFTSTIFSSFNTYSKVLVQPMSPYEYETNNHSYDDDNNNNNNYVPNSYIYLIES
jgi:hypothetical protein